MVFFQFLACILIVEYVNSTDSPPVLRHWKEKENVVSEVLHYFTTQNNVFFFFPNYSPEKHMWLKPDVSVVVCHCTTVSDWSGIFPQNVIESKFRRQQRRRSTIAKSGIHLKHPVTLTSGTTSVTPLFFEKS